MPAPTLHASGAGLSSVIVTVTATAQNVNALVGVVHDFTGNVPPTLNGSAVSRVTLGTVGSGFGQLSWYLFPNVAAGTLTFAATGRVLGVAVYENSAVVMPTLVNNASGWTLPAPSIGPNAVAVVVNSAAWASDVASPQFVATSTGSVTLTKSVEGLSFYGGYDWGIGIYAVTAATTQTSWSVVPAYTNSPSINRTSRVVLMYVPPASSTTLTRSASGRVASYGATAIANVRDAFNAANWTVSGSAGATVSVVALNLRVSTTTPNGLCYALLANTAAYADGYVQANWTARLRTTDRGGVLARHLDSPINYLRFGANTGNTQCMQEVENNLQTQIATALITVAPSVRLHMKAVGTTAAGKRFGSAESALTGIALTAPAYFGAMQFNNSINTSSYSDYSEFYACSGHKLSVSSLSLPTGWFIRVTDTGSAALATSAGAVGGVAEVDFYGSEIPMTTAIVLEVVDSATNVVLASAVPSETLWGGDSWSFDMAASGFPAARLAHRKAGAARLLLKR